MTPEKKHKGSGALLFSAAIAAALAAGAGYYATHKEEVDKEAKKRVDQLAKSFKETQKEVEKRVHAVWGEVSDEAVATYMDARGALLHAVEEENLAKTGKMIRKKYDEAVDSAVKHARKSGFLDKDIEKKLSELFKMDWNDVQGILTSSAKKMASEVKKEAKRASDEVRKMAVSKKGGAKQRAGTKKKTVRKPAKKAVVKKTASKPAKKVGGKKTVRKPAKKAAVKKTTKKRS